jgi:hypothetical protein
MAHGNRDSCACTLWVDQFPNEEDEVSTRRNKLVLLGSMATLALGSLGAGGVAQARNGADDPAGHDAGDDHGGLVEKRHGSDDAPGDDRGGRRKRAHHRHGAHDRRGHDANDDHGGRRR